MSENPERILFDDAQWQGMFDAVGDAVCLLDCDQKIRRCNRAMAALAGSTVEALVGRPCWEVTHGTAGPIPDCPIRRMLVSRHREGLEVRHGDRWFDVTVDPLFDARQVLQGIVHIVRDVTERKRSQERLEESLSLLTASMDATADGLLVVDRQNHVVVYNRQFMRLWRIPTGALKSGDDKQLLFFVMSQLADPHAFLGKVNELQASPEKDSHDLLACRDGRVYERYSQPQRIGERIVGRVWSFRDITDRQRAEQRLQASLDEKVMLLREIHHRVKNNLQVICSLLSLQSQYIHDPLDKGVFADSLNRVRAMALIHEKLYQAENLSSIPFGEYLRSLSNDLLSAYKVSEVQLRLDVDAVPMTIETAIPCGLIVNELLTNALKYAFPSSAPAGTAHEIDVSLKFDTPRFLVLEVHDNGVGLPADVRFDGDKTLGMQLVAALADQLHGALDVSRVAGTTVRVRFPCPD